MRLKACELATLKISTLFAHRILTYTRVSVGLNRSRMSAYGSTPTLMVTGSSQVKAPTLCTGLTFYDSTKELKAVNPLLRMWWNKYLLTRWWCLNLHLSATDCTGWARLCLILNSTKKIASNSSLTIIDISSWRKAQTLVSTQSLPCLELKLSRLSWLDLIEKELAMKITTLSWLISKYMLLFIRMMALIWLFNLNLKLILPTQPK